MPRLPTPKIAAAEVAKPNDETERLNDLAEVNAQVRSRKSYIEKWSIVEDAEQELQQIAKEQALLQDAFMGGVNKELNGDEDEE
jgi:hypothetical protein